MESWNVKVDTYICNLRVENCKFKQEYLIWIVNNTTRLKSRLAADQKSALKLKMFNPGMSTTGEDKVLIICRSRVQNGELRVGSLREITVKLKLLHAFFLKNQ